MPITRDSKLPPCYKEYIRSFSKMAWLWTIWILFDKNKKVFTVRFFFSTIAFFIVVTCAFFSLSAPPKDLDLIKTHLEFLGYSVSVEDESGKPFTRVNHPSKLGFGMQHYKDGLRIYMNANVVRSEKSFEAINEINAKCIVCRVYIDKKDLLVWEAYFVGEYRKDIFSLFIEAWEKDTQMIKLIFPYLR